ncbi:MAG: MarR family transcriptional regulator [Luminiphilus sp.]|jgi:DNA-binding MarR family transcriptional regulator|nr:MarR family transcriptional regulator [Luminiphilus sp.]
MDPSIAQLSLDHESRIEHDDHQAIRLWLRLLTCTNLIERHLRNRLRSEFDITLPRFDLMAQLAREPQGLTMGDLSQRMMVSGGNVSGIATQLEKEGLISREPVPGNRRAFCVTLTAAGNKRFAEMATAHEGWIVDCLGELSDAEYEHMMAMLKDIKAGVSAIKD